MKFKVRHLEREFSRQVHPALRAVLLELDRLCIERGYAEVTVTELGRTDAMMTAYYGEEWKARGIFSWHLPERETRLVRAADIRNRDWSGAERFAIDLWLKKYWPGAEVLMHDIGRGEHLHLAIPGPWSTIRRLRRALMRRKA